MRDKEQLPQGGQTFPMRTGLPPVRGKEKTPPPTKEEAADANAGVYSNESKVVEKVGRNRVLKPVLVGGAVVAGGAIAYQVPTVHRAVDSSFLDNIKGRLFSSSETQTTNSKQEVFDNNAIKGAITPAMIKKVPEEEIQKLDSFVRLTDQKTEIISVGQGVPEADRAANPDNPFPDFKFQIGEDKNTILLLHPLDFSLSSNPNVKIKYIKNYFGGVQAGSMYLKSKGYHDTIEYKGIPKGTIIRMPVVSENGGYLVMNEGSGYLYFRANDGTSYRLMIIGEKGDNSIPLKPLVDAPELTPEFKDKLKDKGITAGFHVTSGQAILQTPEDVDSISIYVTASKDGVLVPTNLESFVSPDNQLIASD